MPLVKDTRRRWFPAVLFAAVALCSARPTDAAGTAKLSGRVYTVGADQSQTVWPNARVTLKNLRTGAITSTVSNEVGEYSFDGVEPGPCELTVALAGFVTEVRSVMLEPNAAVTLDIRLRLSGQQERVVTRADTVAVDPSSTVAGRELGQPALQSLPLVNDRFQDALPLLPGVVRGPDSLINIKGARSTQSEVLVNSTSVVDPVTGHSTLSLPLEAVESARVLSNPFSAAYGRFTAGVTEVETSSGTDQWKFKITNLLPRLRRHNGIRGIRAIGPRLSLAGPLAKGKLYLFQSAEYRFVRTEVRSLPKLQNDIELETFDSFTQADWNLNAFHRASLQFSFYPQNQAFVTLNTFNAREVTPSFRQRGYFLALKERTIFSGGGFLDSSFSVKRFDAHIFPARPSATPVFRFFPAGNTGTWFHRQDRESHLFQWAQTYHLRPFEWRGTHLVQTGYSYTRATYDGTVANDPVEVVRSDGTLSQRISYGAGLPLRAAKNDLAVFIQDKWQMHPRFALDFGLRVDRDDLSDDAANWAPRVAFVFAPTRDGRTAIRGGVGIFYDRISLNTGSFPAYPQQTVTRFAADGMTVVDGPRAFLHRVAAADGRIEIPYSVAWTVQVDREVRRGLLLRFGYEQRETRRDFYVEPVLVGAGGELQLRNDGRQSYREVHGLVRWEASRRSTLFASYAYTRATGELNVFDLFFGNFPMPIVRANQRQLQPFDAPHRCLFWGTVGLPYKLELSPVLDWRTGFPFSALDDDWNFVGARNRAGRFPNFFALDVQVLRRFRLTVFDRPINVGLGIRLFNVTNHFNPRDVQQNILSPQFGGFFNSVPRQIRGKFEFDF